MKSPKPSTHQPPAKPRAAYCVIFVRIPGEIWPALLAASARPSTLSHLTYTLRKLACVLQILESLATGGSLSAGARRAGCNIITGWKWHQQFLDRGVDGLLPQTHRLGRKAKTPAPPRDKAILLPVRVSLGDLRVRGGHVAFTASARPVLSPAMRRKARRTLRNMERSLPVALRQMLQPREARK